MKLTGWYSGNQKPARVGVYQQFGVDRKTVGYQYWNGNLWFSWCYTPDAAYRARKGCPVAFCYQDDKWRGVDK